MQVKRKLTSWEKGTQLVFTVQMQLANSDGLSPEKLLGLG